MKKVKNLSYIVLESDSRMGLSEYVSDMMLKDWIPLGSVVTPNSDKWIQTMINYHILNDNKRKAKNEAFKK